MINTLVFDWGGVLTKGKYTQAILNTIKQKKRISVDDIYAPFDKLVVEMMGGKISFGEFVDNINEKFVLNTDQEEMKNIFNDSIIPNEGVISFARELSAKYRMIMLSDNDKVTVENLKNSHSDMLDIFEKKYFSFELKTKKPDLGFFEFVIGDFGVSADECVFIDDKQKNVDAAKRTGMAGVLFEDLHQLKRDLRKIGV